MTEDKENEEISELSTWDMPHTVLSDEGYYSTTIPEATSSNMVIYMNKINELIEEVNKLKASKG